jgi:hypothetical protein
MEIEDAVGGTQIYPRKCLRRFVCHHKRQGDGDEDGDIDLLACDEDLQDDP